MKHTLPSEKTICNFCLQNNPYSSRESYTVKTWVCQSFPSSIRPEFVWTAICWSWAFSICLAIEQDRWGICCFYCSVQSIPGLQREAGGRWCIKETGRQMSVESSVPELQMLKFSLQLFLKWTFLKGIKPSNFRPNLWLFKEIHYRALSDSLETSF